MPPDRVVGDGMSAFGLRNVRQVELRDGHAENE